MQHIKHNYKEIICYSSSFDLFTAIWIAYIANAISLYASSAL